MSEAVRPYSTFLPLCEIVIVLVSVTGNFQETSKLRYVYSTSALDVGSIIYIGTGVHRAGEG